MNSDESKNFLERLESGRYIGDTNNANNIESVEMDQLHLEGVLLENVVLHKFASAFSSIKKSTIKNVVFDDCTLFKTDLDDSILENVTFNNCRFASFNPVGVAFKNVTFNRSEIMNASFYLSTGNISISDSKLHNLNFGEASVAWKIAGSKLEKIQAYEIQGRITLTNSTLKDANFEFGKMDSFESYDSTVDALGPGTIKEHLIVKGGQVEWVGVMNANSVHLDGVDIERFAMTDGVIDQVTIENCKNAGLIGFSQSTIKSLTIENCQMEQFRSFLTRAHAVRFTNVSIAGLSMPGASFGQWHLDRVMLAGEIKVEGAAVEQPIFKGLTIADDANVLSSGANFSFSD